MGSEQEEVPLQEDPQLLTRAQQVIRSGDSLALREITGATGTGCTFFLAHHFGSPWRKPSTPASTCRLAEIHR